MFFIFLSLLVKLQAVPIHTGGLVTLDRTNCNLHYVSAKLKKANNLGKKAMNYESWTLSFFFFKLLNQTCP